MGPIKCEIWLKKPSKIYFPSESIQGTVNVCAKSATNISKMELSLMGEGKFANFPWTDDKVSVYNETRCVQLNKILPSGTERFPISWTLPWGLVPTSKWKTASVNYHFVAKIGVKVKGQSCVEEQVTSRLSIEIHNPIDLSLLPLELQNAAEYLTTIPSDPAEQGNTIFLRFVLNRKCFIPGEQLKFNYAVTICNGSNVPARKVFRGTVITLDEELTYMSGSGEEKCLMSNMAKKMGSSAVIKRFPNEDRSGGGDVASTCSFWEDFIKIPNFCNSTPLDLDGFGVVRASYFLNVAVTLLSPFSPSSFGESEKKLFRIPILIGGIPLEETLRCEVQMALMTTRALQPILPWEEDDNGSNVGDGQWELVISDEDYAREFDPPPNIEDVIFNRSETPPPTYAAATEMMGIHAQSESPPKYAP